MEFAVGNDLQCRTKSCFKGTATEGRRFVGARTDEGTSSYSISQLATGAGHVAIEYSYWFAARQIWHTDNTMRLPHGGGFILRPTLPQGVHHATVLEWRGICVTSLHR
jgi:hypothetical protein